MAAALLGTLAVQRSLADERAVAANVDTGAASVDTSVTAAQSAQAANKEPEAEDKSKVAVPETRAVAKRAKRVAPLPSPSAEAVQALEQFQAEASEYEAAARDYRSTLTLVVRHHYEEQRRRILEALDQEIHESQRQVKESRQDAIERLEQFVARYSGPNADPRATPDAMFRLA